MKAQVLKIHSDFYYVNGFECKVRDTLKKQGIQICVGDFVEIENINNLQAIITDVLPRKNALIRPNVCNIDKAIIVSSVKNPDVNFSQLDRYLALCAYHNINAVLVFNKCDLGLSYNLIEKIQKIYGSLSYEIFYTSAKKNIKIKELLTSLKNQTCVFCGPSGVGKTSLINALVPDLKLRTGEVSLKNQKGTHTTRHCEIIEAYDSKFVDTPGFSHLKFDFLFPEEIANLFAEFKDFRKDCKYKNCLHTEEEGCSLHQNMYRLEPSRYLSYLEFIQEAKTYREKVKNEGTKKEEGFKHTHGKKTAKISAKKREKSRRTRRQKIDFDEDIQKDY